MFTHNKRITCIEADVTFIFKLFYDVTSNA